MPTLGSGYALPVNGTWPSIERVPFAELSPRSFAERFALQRRPVVITGMEFNPPAWSWARLQEACGDSKLDFKNHYYVPLKDMQLHDKLGQRAHVSQELRKQFGEDVSIDSIVAAMEEEWTLGRFLDLPPSQRRLNESYNSIVDYFWPLNVHSEKLSTVCPQLSRDASGVVSGIERLLDMSPGKIQQTLFATPAENRAYPMHQHGPVNEVFVLLVSGSKHSLFFPPSEAAALNERPEYAISELSDRVFMPDLTGEKARQARGAETVLQPGEVLYLPADTIHLFENTDPMFSVSFGIDACNAYGVGHMEEIPLKRPGFHC